MTVQNSFIWRRSLPESAKAYTLTLTADGEPYNLTGCTVAHVCSLWSGGSIDITAGVADPATSGVVVLQPSAAQLTAATSGTAPSYVRITHGNGTIRAVPDNGATVDLLLI